MEEIELRDEAELESIIRRNPSKVEPGLLILIDQRKTIGGRKLDLLAVDNAGILTVIELKARLDEGQLQQALNYYDWTLQNIDFIRDAYKNKLEQHKREIKDEMPRIILVAPDFSSELVTAAKYVRDDIDIRLLRYKALSIDGKKEIVPFRIEIPGVKEIEEKPKTIDDLSNYIWVPSVITTFRKAVDILSELSNEEPVTKPHSIKFRYDGRKFAEIHVRQGYFWMALKGEEDWFYKYDVKTFDDVKSIKDQIKTAIELVEGTFKEELFCINPPA